MPEPRAETVQRPSGAYHRFNNDLRYRDDAGAMASLGKVWDLTIPTANERGDC